MTPQDSLASGDSSDPLGDEVFSDFEDTPKENPKEDNPFGDKPKFDAGIDTDEEEDPKKFIQQLSGKLGQSLRSYADTQGEVDTKLEKYAINSVIAGTHPEDMDDSDIKDIVSKLEPKDDGDDVDADVDVDNVDDQKYDGEETLDEKADVWTLDKNHKEVFVDAKLGLNESTSRNIEKYLVSLVDKNLRTKKKIPMKLQTEAPTIEPVTKPDTKPNRRSAPYKPRITPQVDPTPKLNE